MGDDLFTLMNSVLGRRTTPNFKAFITLSQPHEGVDGSAKTRVTDHVEALALDPENTDVYILWKWSHG